MRWLPPPPTSFRSERLSASFAVGHGDDFLYPSSPPLLTASFVRCAAFVLERMMILRWLVEAELTFQIVKHYSATLVPVSPCDSSNDGGCGSVSFLITILSGTGKSAQCAL